MRLFALLLAALALASCAATTTGQDSRTYFGFGDTGNIQIRSTLPFEVCTTGNDGYVQGALHEGGRHCTMLGQPGALHSDMLRYMSAPAHLVWVRLQGQTEWFTITIPRCNLRRNGPCVAEEFDVLLHEDYWDCVTRWESHPSCRSQRYGRGRYQ